MPVHRKLLFVIVASTLFASACGSSGDADAGTDVFEIGLGDCFNDQALAGADDASAEITDVEAISCDQEHQFEVYHTFDMLNDDFPGEAETIDISEAGCLDAFEPFVDMAYADSIFGLSYLYPTDLSWKQGDREVVCVLSMYDGSTKTGTARGAGQ